ncbi:hypothetical protein Hanom_Chr08g00732351 [Helianthus anomalus]
MGFRSEWGAQFPNPNSTALDAPPGYIALYATYFREGNFRLPMTKFTTELTHFEFICKANRIEPTFEKFNIFYFVSYTSGFYSFNSRTSGVSPCSSHPPKSLHDWKQKFFYIRRGVIPVDMHYRAESEGVPKINVSIAFAEQEWYKALTRKATPITQLEERALVGAGMSMLWVPKNPRGVPVYGYQGKGIGVAQLYLCSSLISLCSSSRFLYFTVGYSLLNVLDPKAVGAMIEAILPDGKPVWLDQIRDRFLHPTSESFDSYANTILGEDDEDDLDDATDPVREEVIVLSSGGSDGSHEGLIPRSTRAGPAQGIWNEPVNEPVGDDADPLVETDEQLETRKKKKLDNPEKKEKKVEENGSSSALSVILLDEQVAVALAPRKSKLQKETPPTPSELEINMGVFSAKRGNLLEKIYVASGSQGAKPGKAPRKIDISKITPPTSPPSRTVDLSPLQVGEGGTAVVGGDVGGDGLGEGVDTEAESSEATPRHTIYTKRPPGSGGGASGVPRSPEYENVQRLFQNRRNGLDLLDDHIHAGVNFFATSQEIAWEWQLMGEDTLEFENSKKALAKEREKFNSEKRGCYGGFLMRRRSFPRRNSLTLISRKNGRLLVNGPTRSCRLSVKPLLDCLNKKTKISEEVEQGRVAHQKREQEYIQRIAELERFAEEKVAEVKAPEILAEEVVADCKWLLARAVPQIAERIAGSEELAKYMYELGEAAYAHGRKEGYAEGRAATEAKNSLKIFDLYKTDCIARYAEKRQEFESLEFTIVKATGKLSQKPDRIALLKRALGEDDCEAGGAGTSHQE